MVISLGSPSRPSSKEGLTTDMARIWCSTLSSRQVNTLPSRRRATSRSTTPGCLGGSFSPLAGFVLFFPGLPDPAGFFAQPEAVQEIVEGAHPRYLARHKAADDSQQVITPQPVNPGVNALLFEVRHQHQRPQDLRHRRRRPPDGREVSSS